jgi:hypothetical protein
MTVRAIPVHTLATVLDIPLDHFRACLSGEARMRPALLCQVSGLLGVPLAALFEEPTSAGHTIN